MLCIHYLIWSLNFPSLVFSVHCGHVPYSLQGLYTVQLTHQSPQINFCLCALSKNIYSGLSPELNKGYFIPYQNYFHFISVTHRITHCQHLPPVVWSCYLFCYFWMQPSYYLGFGWLLYFEGWWISLRALCFHGESGSPILWLVTNKTVIAIYSMGAEVTRMRLTWKQLVQLEGEIIVLKQNINRNQC